MINSGSAGAVNIALQAISAADQDRSKSMESLQTGERINNAGDDVAGVSGAAKLRGEITAVAQGIRNIGDFGGFLGTAETIHTGAIDILQQMRVLALQSSSGVNSSNERFSINDAAQNLLTQYRQETTGGNLAARFLVDGSFMDKQLTLGAGDDKSLKISIRSIQLPDIGRFSIGTEASLSLTTGAGAATGPIQSGAVFRVNSLGRTAEATLDQGMSARQLGDKLRANGRDSLEAAGVELIATTQVKLSALTAGNMEFKLNGVSVGGIVGADGDLSNLASQLNGVSNRTGVTARLDDTRTALTLTDALGNNISVSDFQSSDGARLELTALEDGVAAGATSGTHTGILESGGNLGATVTGRLSLLGHENISIMQTANTAAGQGFVEGDLKNSTFESLGDLDLSTADGALKAVSILDHSIARVETGRGRLGATQNTLDSLTRGLGRLQTNLENSHAYIMGADMAQEVSRYAQSRIMLNAAQAMLGQGMKVQSQFLNLLRG